MSHHQDKHTNAKEERQQHRDMALQRDHSAKASTLTFEPTDFDGVRCDADGRFGVGNGERSRQSFIIDQSQQALRWDKQVLNLPLKAINTQKLRDFAKRAGLVWSRLGTHEPQRVEQALSKLEVLQDQQLLNAAQLFFTTEPVHMRCAVFMGTSSATIIDRHDFDGDILSLIEEAQKYILKNIHIGMRLEGLYRVDVPEISMDALREAIINAFCHRDWHDPDHVQIAIYKDRVEIRNPGTLMGNLTIADIRQGNVSRRRNPLVAELFRRIHMVEAWGRGMPLIMSNAPEVEFREVAGLFIASFARSSFLQAAAPSDEPESTVDKTVDKPPLSERESALCAILMKEPQLTQKQLGARLGLTERGTRYLTDKLQREGVLQRQGGKKTGAWRVLTYRAKVSST
jgi:ATP-dependent DNA helicase RecG